MLELYQGNTIIRSYLLFLQTADAVRKYTDAVLFRHTRVSMIKMRVLELLEANGGTMEPSKIAEQILREAHGVTTLVRRMQKDGLVVAKRNEKDRRYVIVTITDKGRALIKDTLPAGIQIIDRIMASLGEKDAIQLIDLLKVLRKNAYEGLDNISQRS